MSTDINKDASFWKKVALAEMLSRVEAENAIKSRDRRLLAMTVLSVSGWLTVVAAGLGLFA